VPARLYGLRVLLAADPAGKRAALSPSRVFCTGVWVLQRPKGLSRTTSGYDTEFSVTQDVSLGGARPPQPGPATEVVFPEHKSKTSDIALREAKVYYLS